MGAAEFVFQDFNIDDRLLKKQAADEHAQKLEERFHSGYDQGHKKGVEEGLAQGRQEILESLTKSTTDVLEKLDCQLKVMSGDIDLFYSRVEEMHQKILTDVFQKCVPDLYNNPITSHVLGLLETHKSILQNHAVVTISVHKDVLDEVQKHLLESTSLETFKEKLCFDSREDFAPNDLKISWENGGVERFHKTFMEDLNQLMGIKEEVQEVVIETREESDISAPETDEKVEASAQNSEPEASLEAETPQEEPSLEEDKQQQEEETDV